MELEDILCDEQGQKCFMEFLTREFSNENLQFWLKCQEFKRINNKKQLKKCCEQMYSKYISLQGSHAVNIDHLARKLVEDNLKKPHCNMFAAAENQIFQLMQSDSFSRFLESDLFAAFKATKSNNKEVYTQLAKYASVSSRKRKLTGECYGSRTNSYSGHTYENESQKNARLSNKNFLAKSQVATSQIGYQSESVPREQHNSIDLQSIQCQNAFLFSESDQCDSESLYCNVPIYSMDASFESSQVEPPHHHTEIDPKWFNNRFIRVVFPDCSEEFITISSKLPIRTLVENLLAKKRLNYSSYKMFSIQTNELIDLDKDISSIVFNDARIEQRINFSMHFPEGYLINVETLPNKLAFQTVKAILAHFGITWQDIELYDDHGHLLNSSLLMEPVFDLDHSNIYVNYLSSLRTYLNLKDINDLNEDGITIRSIQFAEYSRPKTSKAVSQAKVHTLPRSFSSFVVETPHFAEIRPTQRVVEEKSGGHLCTNVANETKDIDIGELSFSNQNDTDVFLTDIMTSDISKLNFICTPQKKQRPNEVTKFIDANVYENLNSNAQESSHYSQPRKENTPVHKARFVIIDENEYENVIEAQNGLPKAYNSFPKPFYANQEVTFDKRYCDCQPNSNILKPRNQVPNLDMNSAPASRSLRRLSQVPKPQLVSTKACPSPISFTKYLLLQSSSGPQATQATRPQANNHTPTVRPTNRITLSASNNFTNFCITPLKSNKPDLLVSANSSSKQMRTLSRFHKII